MALAVALICGGCSMRGFIDRMVSDKDRALATGVVEALRSGDGKRLEELFDPEIRESSLSQIPQLPTQFPTTPGKTEIVAFNSSSNYVNGTSSESKHFTLVTTDEKLWTTTNLQFASDGGPLRLTAWKVTNAREKPSELQMLDTMDTVLPIAAVVGLLLLAGFVVLIIVLVNRSTRRDRERGIAGPR